MSVDIKSSFLTQIEPGAKAMLPIDLDADIQRLLNGKHITFEPTLGRLKSEGEPLVLDVSAGCVLITNRNTREIIIKAGQRLGTIALENQKDDVHESSSTAWPTIQDAAAQTSRKNRASRAVPIVAPPPQVSPLTTPQQKQGVKIVKDPCDSTGNSGHTAPSSLSSSPLLRTPSSRTELSNLDVYARAYIPDALRAINALPAQQIVTEALQRIDYTRYSSSFAGNLFLPTTVTNLELPLDNHSKIDTMFPDQLNAEKYATYWSSALVVEIAARKEANTSLALFDVPIQYDLQRNVLSLTVPGLAEGNLHVEVGDQVMLRQLRVLQQWHPLHSGKVLQPGPSMGFTGVEHVVNVVGIFRRQELLELRPEGRLVPESMRFNVQFSGQERREEALTSALSHASQSMNMDGSWLSRMLFPTREQCILQTQLNSAYFSFTPFDPNLNMEQLRAVESITKHKYGQLPFLIDGPPGTGKTKTLVEAILQLVQADNNNNTFLSAHHPILQRTHLPHD